MASIELTDDQLVLLETLAENAVNDARETFSQHKRAYSADFKHYRVEAAKLALTQAEQALVLVRSWKPPK